MKIQPIMNNQCVANYSDSTTTAPGHGEFYTKHTIDSIVDERKPINGLSCTGDLDYPAAKAISALSPAGRKSCSSCGKHQFDTTANKIFTRELVSSNTVKKSRTAILTNDCVSTFDKDLLESLLAEKINRLKLGEVGGDHQKSCDRCNSAATRSKVHFSKVTIQEYSVQPGVHPGGSKGCPLTIGWDPIITNTVDLEFFENARCENRRCAKQLKLVAAHRETILKGLGYTSRAIMAGTKAANLARRGRYSTISTLKSSQSQEMIEDFRNSIHNLVTFGSKKRREQKYLAPYMESNKDDRVLKEIKLNFSPNPRISAAKVF